MKNIYIGLLLLVTSILNAAAPRAMTLTQVKQQYAELNKDPITNQTQIEQLFNRAIKLPGGRVWVQTEKIEFNNKLEEARKKRGKDVRPRAKTTAVQSRLTEEQRAQIIEGLPGSKKTSTVPQAPGNVPSAEQLRPPVRDEDLDPAPCLIGPGYWEAARAWAERERERERKREG